MQLHFEWDENKAREQLKKHKVSFEEAKTVFNDPPLITFTDEEHSATEDRYISIGISAPNKVLLVIHTERETAEDTLIVRLISCRKATASEQKPMKKAKTEPRETIQTDMRPEYDFTAKKGVRGKYYRAYRQGHAIQIHKADGTVSIQYFTLEDGAVMLEADVRRYFPNSGAVNTALRSLIALIPAKSAKHKAIIKSHRP